VASTPSIRIVKTSPFKGGSRLWSNRYHFLGGTPADAAHWHTLMDNVTAAEKATLNIDSQIVEALGYAAGSDVPVATKVYALTGTSAVSSAFANCPLEVAALIRWSTAARTTKNHPIYLFSYMHATYISTTAADQDHLHSVAKSQYATYATSWITGFSDGTITATRAGPNGQAATGSLVEEYVTHRDFPYSTSV
jgi:hypothetical protein